jgi:polyhydroxybutyrate depolymerase
MLTPDRAYVVALVGVMALGSWLCSCGGGGDVGGFAETPGATPVGGQVDGSVANAPEVDAALPDAEVGDAHGPRPSSPASPGCGLGRSHPSGGVQVVDTFSATAGGERSFFLSVPDSYDSTAPQRLIVGYAGTNWTGQQIAPYLGLETAAPQVGELYVYPDVQWHDFEGWGALGGWLLGPHAHPADGVADIAFTRELVERLGEQYCVDSGRVFAAGHSWGGDMAAVVGCFLGDVFAAVAPAAANRPYWFEPEQGEVACQGTAAVWTFFGQHETSFTSQAYPGQYGDQQVAFWKTRYGCGDTEVALSPGSGECVQYEGCDEDIRYCFYGPETEHQIPDYYAATVLAWFRAF